MIKLCIFDLDGTLTNTLPAISHFGNTALLSIGLGEITMDRYRYLVGDGRDILIHRMLAEFSQDNEENFNRAAAEYDKAYESDPLYKTAPYDGIYDLLSALKNEGVTLCILSNKPDNVVRDIARLFFGDSFSYTMGHLPENKVKPDPALALSILDKCGVSPDEAIFIGDTDVDIKTGKNAGMKTVGVLWGFREKDELINAGADFLAEKPGDIFDIILK